MIPEMPSERTGAGDASRTLALLWRHEVPLPTRRGPRPAFTVDDVVARAIATADVDGLAGLTMRGLADDLGVTPMALYGYVPGKAELLDLMLDDRLLALPRRGYGRLGWRRRLVQIAHERRALHAAHPWTAEISTGRPPLGPGVISRYDHELGAVEGIGLLDVEMDAVVAQVGALARTYSLDREAAAAAAASQDDATWWAANGPLLAQVLAPARYPLASRVGAAAGAEHGAAADPDHAFTFALERLLDGVASLVARRLPA